jgi:TrmH family RNA methyltransferase
VLSKSQIKRITSLGQKKYRNREGIFVAEGIKVIQELLDSSLILEGLWSVDDSAFSEQATKVAAVTLADLKKVSFLKTPQTAIAIFRIPEAKKTTESGLTLLLDDVRDPGNLGTIIRLCDWFGITDLVCSKETVDCYNPKVVQATMGSLTRVNVVYADLIDYVGKTKRPIYGTFMDGDNVYSAALPKDGILVMGNEANGISSEIESKISQRIGIPRFGPKQATESLNVATAAAIFLSEFRRSSSIGR